MNVGQIKQSNKTRIQRSALYPVNLRIPKSLDREIEIAAAMREITKQQLLENALLEYLNVEFEVAQEA